MAAMYLSDQDEMMKFYIGFCIEASNSNIVSFKLNDDKPILVKFVHFVLQSGSDIVPF